MLFVSTNIYGLSANGIFCNTLLLDALVAISINRQAVQLNDQFYSRQHCSRYDATIDFGQAKFETLESLLELATQKHLDLFPKLSLVAMLLPSNEKHFQTSFEIHFLANARSSIEKIKSGSIINGINQLKGTGFGLTPSGDDFNAGLLLGMFYTESKNDCDLKVLRQEIWLNAKGNNQLSNAFLWNASQGYFHYAFHNFLNLTPQNFDFEAHLQSLLAHGATSGADLLSGFIFSIQNKIGL